MADNLGPMAWLFLPENVQVQYLQKIALRAENPSGPNINPKIHEKKTKRTKNEERDKANFPRKRFSAAYWRQHIFRPSLRY